MRKQFIPRRVIGFALAVMILGGTLAEAAPPERKEPAADPMVTAAQTALELATLQLRRYERVEYPLKLRRLESEIKLTAAEVASHERTLAEYQKFTRDKVHPFFLSQEQANLARLSAQLRLDDLKEEKLLLERYHSEQRRIYEIEVEVAHERLQQLSR